MKREAEYDLLKSFILDKVSHVYDTYGLNPAAEEPFPDSQLRPIAANYMCSYGNTDCTDQAKAEFNKWFTSSDPDDEASNTIDPSIRSIVYCTAVQSGNNAVWDWLFERYQKSNNGNERNTILSALGCTSDSATLQK